MEELDVLKKDWNKNNNYPTVSEQEIYTMLHKNSSSTIKWIFIISIIELSFGIILSIVMSFTKFDAENMQFLKNLNIYGYYQVSVIVMYIVIVYFITRFYIMYRRVCTTDNTKLLMKNILRTRKTVQNYILFNLVTFALVFITFASYGLKIGIEKATIEKSGSIAEIPMSVYLISFFVLLIITGILTGAFWLVYRLIYGILLKKLKKNFEELKKIDL
ncbi:hypothetical protein [Flavobacterium sp.]|uniref:hypothetical protein n=1 Tax=Flavobacterium sp. TaxID=239 RepID=UPI003D6B9F09